MKNKTLALDSALMALWTIVLLNSSSINNKDLVFGWSLQTHLVLTGALIALRMIYKKYTPARK